MPLKEAQDSVDKWTSQFTPQYWPPHEMFARLVEEVGELAREINHNYGIKKKKKDEPIKLISEEIGDILFTLICIANSQKIDLDDAFSSVMDKCYGRDKDRYKKLDEFR